MKTFKYKVLRRLGSRVECRLEYKSEKVIIKVHRKHESFAIHSHTQSMESAAIFRHENLFPPEIEWDGTTKLC